MIRTRVEHPLQSWGNQTQVQQNPDPTWQPEPQSSRRAVLDFRSQKSRSPPLWLQKSRSPLPHQERRGSPPGVPSEGANRQVFRLEIRRLKLQIPQHLLIRTTFHCEKPFGNLGKIQRRSSSTFNVVGVGAGKSPRTPLTGVLCARRTGAVDPIEPGSCIEMKWFR